MITLASAIGEKWKSLYKKYLVIFKEIREYGILQLVSITKSIGTLTLKNLME